MVLCGNMMWICYRVLGSLQFFVVKAFLETCLFLIIGQHKGLALCNNDSEHDKIVEEVSEAWMMIRSG